jgi:hypothetical protein
VQALNNLHAQLDDLGERVDRYAEQIRRRTNVGIFLGSIATLIAVMMTVAIFAVVQDVDENEDSRTQDLIAGCIHFNVQRQEVRQALKGGLLAIVPATAVHASTADKIAALTDIQRAQYERYSAEVDLQLPYRDCSPAGIKQYFERPPVDPNGR